PCLIIIDGLDECSAIEGQQDLLCMLEEATKTTSLIRFLVCSRPESHLKGFFGSPRMVPIVRNVFLGNDYVSREDIRTYIEAKFKQIKEEHVFKRTLPEAWPTPPMIDNLVYRSSGQFIYVVTVAKYMESPRHRPDQRLDAVFK
ncbi:hypothetical protein CPC08DRAFT_596522, partial [Agrocybe pediades]